MKAVVALSSYCSGQLFHEALALLLAINISLSSEKNGDISLEIYALKFIIYTGWSGVGGFG